MTLNIQKSGKLFYNKWPYKIACYIDGANRLTYLGIDIVREFCNGERTESMPYWMSKSRLSTKDKEQLLQFTNKVAPYLDLKNTGQGQIRAEGSHFNLFCQDKGLMETIYTELEPWIDNVYGPSTDEELEFMLASNNQKVTCDHLPHKKYQFKIYLKTDMLEEKRTTFLKWIKTYQDRVLISKTTKRWLENNASYTWTQCPFLYVEDAKSLTMIGLFLSSNIKKVEEFIPRSSINTILDQEQTCQH